VQVEAAATQPRFASPEAYTPRHLAEKILTSKATLEGERKQVTVLFADLKGSMELLADRDPEEARTLLDPVLERMIEAVHNRSSARLRTPARIMTASPWGVGRANVVDNWSAVNANLSLFSRATTVNGRKHIRVELIVAADGQTILVPGGSMARTEFFHARVWAAIPLPITGRHVDERVAGLAGRRELPEIGPGLHRGDVFARRPPVTGEDARKRTIVMFGRGAFRARGGGARQF
jgi:class 3 adenylate cyclase